MCLWDNEIKQIVSFGERCHVEGMGDSKLGSLGVRHLDHVCVMNTVFRKKSRNILKSLVISFLNFRTSLTKHVSRHLEIGT